MSSAASWTEAAEHATEPARSAFRAGLVETFCWRARRKYPGRNWPCRSCSIAFYCNSGRAKAQVIAETQESSSTWASDSVFERSPWFEATDLVSGFRPHKILRLNVVGEKLLGVCVGALAPRPQRVAPQGSLVSLTLFFFGVGDSGERITRSPCRSPSRLARGGVGGRPSAWDRRWGSLGRCAVRSVRVHE